MKKGPKGCPETSVRNYHYSLHNTPEERSSHHLSDGSLKSQSYSCSTFITLQIGHVCLSVSLHTPASLQNNRRDVLSTLWKLILKITASYTAVRRSGFQLYVTSPVLNTNYVTRVCPQKSQFSEVARPDVLSLSS